MEYAHSLAKLRGRFMRFKYILAAMAISTLTLGCDNQHGSREAKQEVEPLVDVPLIAGKSKIEVSELIGAPENCTSIRQGDKCAYVKAETEIVFIDGKADWITIEGLDDQEFADATIELLGFQSKRASFSNDFVKKWEPIEGLISASLFKGSSGADYAYIKAYTK